MLHRISTFVAASASLIAATIMLAQQPQPAPSSAAPPQTPSASAEEVEGGPPSYVKVETPQQRRDRVGAVDPGPNPDEKTKFYRYGKEFHIARFEKKWASFDQEIGRAHV